MQNRRQKEIYGRLASEKRQKGTGKRKEWKKKRAKLEGEKANIKRVDDVVSGCCFGMRTGPRRLTGSSKTDFASAGGRHRANSGRLHWSCRMYNWYEKALSTREKRNCSLQLIRDLMHGRNPAPLYFGRAASILLLSIFFFIFPLPSLQLFNLALSNSDQAWKR
ncbi:uncharacterized protein BO88DRAFT_265745 [Aspergillus vadensis CBS 113365]|uniref:Uncharacterized protein n=1 Tax=Aspergillus vadensis (strain CBS 113365 / IMI 142717 / IBT 24658) TaxID=1448311 RepID=A0A319BBQ5_ASPVC|nr:hypothetical protein BO88DRAFT_265745 [Aspergillus vadensis CBS 113365]PYH70486.1 hypothetical protein BO88DRAFT_265745 [Aspergillus vadensis CBS 113365]